MKAIFLFILTLGSVLPLAAQQSIRLRALTLFSEKLPLLYVHDLAAPEGTPGVPLQAKSYLNHEEIKISARGNRFVLTALEDSASRTQKDAIVSQFALPEGQRLSMLLFYAKNPEELAVLPLEDSPRIFKPGGIRLLNLSNTGVRVTIGEGKYDLRPGANEVVGDPPMDERGQAMSTVAVLMDGELKKISSTRLSLNETSRFLQIFHFNPMTKQVEKKAVKDISVPKLDA